MTKIKFKKRCPVVGGGSLAIVPLVLGRNSGLFLF